MNKNMFGIEAKALMKSVGADRTLISNSNMDERLDLLQLVRVTEGRVWPVTKYRPMEFSLPQLMNDDEFSPGFEEKTLVNSVINNMKMTGSGKAGGGDGVVGEAKVSVGVDNVDGLEAPFDMMSKTVNLKTVRNWFDSRKIKKNKLQKLRLKEKDRLMFVHRIVYNKDPVRLFSRSKVAGSFSASFQKMVNVSGKGNKEVETGFTVPEKSTFAYGLMEINGVQEEINGVQEEILDIAAERWMPKEGKFGIQTLCAAPMPMMMNVCHISKEPWMRKGVMSDMPISSDASHDSANTSDSLQQVKEALKNKVDALQPLADVPASTSRKLLNTLSELLKDREALTLLEQTLESGTAACEDPQSEAVSAFLDALNVSTTTLDQKDAVHLLVSALDTLPDDVPALLIGCSSDVLRVLKQLVDGLQEDGQNQLPEALPPPLQEDGELGWVAPLLCSTDDMLAEREWLTPELPPGVLLEVVALVVHGLSLMQNL